jgi:hypothetical protein
MRTNETYFEEVYARESKLKNAILNFLILISSYPRLIIEVFTRRRFGERYFSTISVIIVTALMFYLPFLMEGDLNLYRYQQLSRYGMSTMDGYGTWFAYAGLFLLFSIWHMYEIDKNGSVLKFQRFSLSTGQVHPFFLKIPFVSIKTIDIYIEPLPFFIGGYILSRFGQSIGTLLMICSIIHSLSHMAAYAKGESFLMDKVDEMIFNESLERVFVDDESSDKNRGVRVYSDKPTSPELRKKVVDAMLGKDDEAVAI